MPSRRYKRKSAHDLSKQLRRKFYRVAAIATLVYVALSLVGFHAGLYVPQILGIMWAVFLLSYTSFKEAIRWNNAGDEEVYRGELWAGLVLTGAVWMIGWNIGRTWFFNLPSVALPDDYEAAVIETIVLYTLSVISSFLYKYRKLKKGAVHQKILGKKARRIPSIPKPAITAEKKLSGVEPAQNPNIEVVLTKAPTPEKEDPPPPQAS